MKIGLANAIAKAAGPELIQESKQYIQRRGTLSVADVCITTAGRMPSKKVFYMFKLYLRNVKKMTLKIKLIDLYKLV